MAQTGGQAPLVQFAQKATAIVKAAGFDPKAIDLETFRRLAPIIFTRAYCAIYKEQLLQEISEYSNREDQILNSQLVIDGLTAKTRNSALATISGIDIFQGNHRAVGILAGVLFAEGQRLWMEKMKTQKPPLSMKSDGVSAKEGKVEAQTEPGEVAESLTAAQERKKIETMMASSIVPPQELEKLMNRIAYLENRLKRKTKRVSASPQRRSSRSPTSRSASPTNRRSNSPETRLRKQNASSNKEDVYGKNADDTSDISDNDGESLNAPEGDHDSEPPPTMRRRPKSGRRNRPSSAPSTRRVKEVSSRLYNAPLNKQILEVAQAPAKPKPPIVNPLFTYDMKSGRRILVAQAEHQRELREQAKKAMGNLNTITNDEDEFMGGERRGGHGPTNAVSQYPCKSIETSVEEWVKKARQVGGLNDGGKSGLPSARHLNVYSNLRTLDMMVTIEHCHNCEHHQITTRHNAHEYKKLADDFLRVLAEVILHSGLCVRLGVASFEAEITCRSKTTDENSRIGAFEVQVASKNAHGDFLSALLHSKLFSGRWPSKSVLEKRLKAFVSKLQLPTVHCTSDGYAVTDYNMEISEGQNYPVGRCNISDTALGDPLWSFASFQQQSTSNNNSIMWVFDTKDLQHQAKFRAQDRVFVKNIVYQPGFVEKYPLPAIVKRYESSSGNGNQAPNHNKTARMLYVQLQYQPKSELRVSESDCLGEDDFHLQFPEPQQSPRGGSSSSLPFDLEAMLLLAQKEQKLVWTKGDDVADSVIDAGAGEYLLSPTSLYQQLRKMAWTLVIYFVQQRNQRSLTHPTSGRVFDAHRAYSERTLRTMIDRFGPVTINTRSLERALPNHGTQQQQPSAIVPISPSTASIISAGATATSSPRMPATPAASSAINPNNSNHSLMSKASTISPANTPMAPAAVVTASTSSTAPTTVSTPTVPTAAPTAPISAAQQQQRAQLQSMRPSAVSTRPPPQALAELRQRVVQQLSKSPAENDPVSAFISRLSEQVQQVQTEHATVDHDGRTVRLQEVIRVLYDFRLDTIADSAQDMKAMAAYLSPDEDEMSSALSLQKVAAWLQESREIEAKAPDAENTSPSSEAEPMAEKSSPVNAPTTQAAESDDQAMPTEETPTDFKAEETADSSLPGAGSQGPSPAGTIVNTYFVMFSVS